MSELTLTQDKSAIVDDDDIERVSQFLWRYQRPTKVNKTGYAVRAVTIKGKKTPIYLHREIMTALYGPSALIGMTVDHINGNGLDNRKNNLRLCSQLQNNVSVGLTQRNKSGFKGVCWHKGNSRWYVALSVDGKRKFVGMYSDPVEAAKAYDSAAKRAYGEFAYLNFPMVAA